MKDKVRGYIPFDESAERLIEDNTVVSVWVGDADSFEDLQEYIIDYIEDTDNLDEAKSYFGVDFGFCMFDMYFLDYYFRERTSSVSDLFSCIAELLPSVREKAIQKYGEHFPRQYSAVLTLISYRYVPDEYYRPYNPDKPDVQMEFLDVFPYDETISLVHAIPTR